MPTEGILPGTAAYASQVLRTKKVQNLTSFSAAGMDPLLATPDLTSVIPTSTVAAQLSNESTLILSARGTFYQVKLASNYGPGVYSIDELTREVTAPDFIGPNTFRRPGETTSPILLTAVEFNQVDITSQVPCLDNVKVFYSFGQNFGQVVISGEVLLGPLGDINYDGVERLVSFFWKNRVSEKRQAIAVSVANNSYFVYLTGLRISRVDPDFHIMPFVMFGTLLDISREKSSVVNAPGKVIHGGNLDEPSLFEAMLSLPEATTVSQTTPPETPAPIGPNNNPSQNAVAGGGTGVASNAGAAGNTTAAQIQDGLNMSPALQTDIELAGLRQANKDIRKKTQSVYAGVDYGTDDAVFGSTADVEADRVAAPLVKQSADYDKAIKYGKAMRAQQANQAADGKVQNYTMTPEVAAYKPIYDRLVSEQKAQQAGNSLPGKTENTL